MGREAFYESFLGICKEIPAKTALMKQKYVKSNHSPFLNKEIQKTIMNPTGLRNRFLKSSSIEDMLAYNRQKNSLSLSY